MRPGEHAIEHGGTIRKEIIHGLDTILLYNSFSFYFVVIFLSIALLRVMAYGFVSFRNI